MMTLDEMREHYETALEYYGAVPSPYARSARLYREAELETERAKARAFDAAEGPVEQRKARAVLDIAVIAAQGRELDAYEEFLTQKQLDKRAEGIQELYNIETANARRADKIR